MSIIGDLGWAQSMAAETMTDACTINADDGPGTFDEDTRTYTPDVGDELYSGRCLVSPVGAVRDVTVATLREVIGRYYLDLPHDAAVIPVGAVVEITSSADAALEGQTMRVSAKIPQTVHTRRRLIVEDPQVVDL